MKNNKTKLPPYWQRQLYTESLFAIGDEVMVIDHQSGSETSGTITGIYPHYYLIQTKSFQMTASKNDIAAGYIYLLKIKR